MCVLSFEILKNKKKHAIPSEAQIYFNVCIRQTHTELKQNKIVTV